MLLWVRILPKRMFKAFGSSVEIDSLTSKQDRCCTQCVRIGEHTVEDHFAAVVTLRSQEELPNPTLPYLKLLPYATPMQGAAKCGIEWSTMHGILLAFGTNWVFRGQPRQERA
jgi:hypothetical protein